MVHDVTIIIASQKVEHYEIATHGSLAELAKRGCELHERTVLHPNGGKS